ncbi:NAD(P)/FAD-dependent oxidoreductase [Streptomyces sp. NBC_00568]|uniref:NAD(P)/FAD-dependent oxidoreductase n=1 Tax=Streptomyces sp. NBC_00568 TaxID=2975779 RepID=UPI00225B9130|nr:hypothetical protein [Streptomyces sp. NBC_00568]MCX4993649.1 hypothetical protein [Streptomyces sp. NBC_00568]
MPGGYRALARELPGTVSRLLSVGGHPHNMIGGSLNVEQVGPRRETDDQFETIAARRPVLEMALFTEASITPGITITCGVTVTGLLTGDAKTLGKPHIAGVTTKGGGSILADLVVDATGRNSHIPGLLAELGAAPAEERAETGFRYYTRYFRSASGNLPRQPAWPIYHYNSITAITAPGDNGTWSLTLVTSGRDQELRSLKDPEIWTRVAARYPDVAHWLEGEPITGINVMGGTETKHREYVQDGRPVVTGLVAVGDSWATTNPQYGMGMTMGIWRSLLLRDAIRKHGTDNPVELSIQLERDTEQTLSPIWHGSLSWDTHRLNEIDAEMRGETYATDDPDWNLRQLLDATRLQDPEILRGYAEAASMVTPANEVLARDGLLERILQLGTGTPRYPFVGPDRTELLALVAS